MGICGELEFEIFEKSIHLEFGAFLFVELRFVSHSDVVVQELTHLLDVNSSRGMRGREESKEMRRGRRRRKRRKRRKIERRTRTRSTRRR